MLLRLVRHGESQANVGEVDPRDVGDHNIELTEKGVSQARALGGNIGSAWLKDALIYKSPYQRTRQTLDSICRGAGFADGSAASGLQVYEDPRLREVEHGYDEYEGQQPAREIHGWFYYRFAGGESPADCFDRTSAFIDSLMRQVARKDRDSALVVTHGLTIRCFVMRFLHLTVEEFEDLANPGNCDVIEIGRTSDIDDATHTSGRWASTGLKLRG